MDSLYDIEDVALVNNWDEKILQILEPGLELDNDNIGLYISQHSKKGLIKDAKQHYELLKYAIKNAKSEIYIMAPWVSKNVVDDEYKKVNTETLDIEQLVMRLKDNKALGFASKDEVIEIIQEMHKIIGKENFIYKGPTHAKILIVDSKYMFIGSIICYRMQESLMKVTEHKRQL